MTLGNQTFQQPFYSRPLKMCWHPRLQLHPFHWISIFTSCRTQSLVFGSQTSFLLSQCRMGLLINRSSVSASLNTAHAPFLARQHILYIFVSIYWSLSLWIQAIAMHGNHGTAWMLSCLKIFSTTQISPLLEQEFSLAQVLRTWVEGSQTSFFLPEYNMSNFGIFISL